MPSYEDIFQKSILTQENGVFIKLLDFIDKYNTEAKDDNISSCKVDVISNYPTVGIRPKFIFVSNPYLAYDKISFYKNIARNSFYKNIARNIQLLKDIYNNLSSIIKQELKLPSTYHIRYNKIGKTSDNIAPSIRISFRRNYLVSNLYITYDDNDIKYIFTTDDQSKSINNINTIEDIYTAFIGNYKTKIHHSIVLHNILSYLYCEILDQNNKLKLVLKYGHDHFYLVDTFLDIADFNEVIVDYNNYQLNNNFIIKQQKDNLLNLSHQTTNLIRDKFHDITKGTLNNIINKNLARYLYNNPNQNINTQIMLTLCNCLTIELFNSSKPIKNEFTITIMLVISLPCPSMLPVNKQDFFKYIHQCYNHHPYDNFMLLQCDINLIDKDIVIESRICSQYIKYYANLHPTKLSIIGNNDNLTEHFFIDNFAEKYPDDNCTKLYRAIKSSYNDIIKFLSEIFLSDITIQTLLKNIISDRT